MSHETAHVVGTVEYREGDGANLQVPHGPIEVEATRTDATLSWSDGPTHGSAAIPLSDYQRYVDEGAIKLDR